MTLVAAGGHVHPGGLSVDLRTSRDHGAVPDRIDDPGRRRTKKPSWYEVMGIIDPRWVSFDPAVVGRDPFAQNVDWHGVVTHGHVQENDNHGSRSAAHTAAEFSGRVARRKRTTPAAAK
jgi:hypothetical protein